MKTNGNIDIWPLSPQVQRMTQYRQAYEPREISPKFTFILRKTGL